METINLSQPGFELGHIGINQKNAPQAEQTAQLLAALFGFPMRDTPGSIFVNEQFEVLKKPFLGELGHISIRTVDVEKAKAYLEEKGVAFNESTANYGPDGKLNTIYLQEEIGGFAFHLARKA